MSDSAECSHHFGTATEYGSFRDWQTWLAHSPIWLPVVVGLAYTLSDPYAVMNLITAVEPGEHFQLAPMVFFLGIFLTAVGGLEKRVYVFQFGMSVSMMAAIPSFAWVMSLSSGTGLPGAMLVGISVTGVFFSWAAMTAMFDFNVECARGECNG